MRLMVAFDLPMVSKRDKRVYTKFRKFQMCIRDRGNPDRKTKSEAALACRGTNLHKLLIRFLKSGS